MTGGNDMRLVFALIGLMLVLAGVVCPWCERVCLGRLSGNRFWRGSGNRVYLPLASMSSVGILLSLILWLPRR